MSGCAMGVFLLSGGFVSFEAIQQLYWYTVHGAGLRLPGILFICVSIVLVILVTKESVRWKGSGRFTPPTGTWNPHGCSPRPGHHMFGVCWLHLRPLFCQESGFLELRKPGSMSHCREECETIAKVRGWGWGWGGRTHLLLA